MTYRPLHPLRRAHILAWLAASVLLIFPLSGRTAESASNEWQQRDYENRLAAVKSIQTALSKHTDKPGIDETLREVEIKLRKAETNATGKDYGTASKILNDSNVLLRTTLVRLLNAPEKPSTAGNGTLGDTAQTNQLHPSREHVERDFEYTRSLVHALRRKTGVKPEDIVQIENNIQTAGTLLGAGKNLDADLLIDTTYAQAKGLLVKLETSSQIQSGSAALDTATRSSSATVDTKDLRDQFARREESVLSLRSACEQMVKEQPQHQALLVDSGALLAAANQEAKQGQYPKAIATLDRSYLLLKIGISAIRGGQQVTASRNFSDPADEYRYEQRRNDDYGQLIGGLIERTPRTDWKAIAEIAKAKRSSADVSASTGNWPAALQQIDESTIEHKKILRSAGYSIM